MRLAQIIAIRFSIMPSRGLIAQSVPLGPLEVEGPSAPVVISSKSVVTPFRKVVTPFRKVVTPSKSVVISSKSVVTKQIVIAPVSQQANLSGSGEWNGPVKSSYFGGAGDEQSVAYPYQGMVNTEQLDAAGILYFASRNPSWAGRWIEFKVGNKIAEGVQCDYGPATFTGRYFDFSGALGRALNYRTDQEVFWRFK